MDPYQLRYFLVIVETGGFTKAAERLFVSQPSLYSRDQTLCRTVSLRW